MGHLLGIVVSLGHSSAISQGNVLHVEERASTIYACCRRLTPDT